MSRVAGGDITSFAALYDVLAPYVYQLAGALSVDERVREQVAADAFTTIWRTARSCPAAGDEALAWTMDITYRHAVAHSPDTGAGDVAAPAGGTGRGSRRALGALPATLTRGQRASTALACGGALTYRQVAEVVGEPSHTVALLQRDALIRLRDAMATAPAHRRDGTRPPSPVGA